MRYTGTNLNDTSNPVSAMDRLYNYDHIGNRESQTPGTQSPITYVANSKNQYESLVDPALPDFDPQQPALPTELFQHDADGNPLEYEVQIGSDRRVYALSWDAENRLTKAEPRRDTGDPAMATGDKKVEFKYDYMSRRVQKLVYEWDAAIGQAGGWESTPLEDRRTVWFGWLPILELNGLDSNAVLKAHTWGLDLAGQFGAVNSLESAGGIGGLLATLDTQGTATAGDDKGYTFLYDGNGNVTQLLDRSNWSVAAHYEYDPFGAVSDSSGTYATNNTFRFSTKPFDAETGLGYWGYRYYSPRLGRWMGRDPIGTRGGMNVYGYVDADPAGSVDALGLSEVRLSEPVQHGSGCVTIEIRVYNSFGDILGTDFAYIDPASKGWRDTLEAQVGLAREKFPAGWLSDLDEFCKGYTNAKNERILATLDTLARLSVPVTAGAELDKIKNATITGLAQGIANKSEQGASPVEACLLTCVEPLAESTVGGGLTLATEMDGCQPEEYGRVADDFVADTENLVALGFACAEAPCMLADWFAPVRTGVSAAAAVAPSSDLVPSGGLAVHEAAGGHAIARHVGLTPSQLAARKLKCASTFLTRGEAEAALSRALQANSGAVNRWLAGTDARFVITHAMPEDVGACLIRGANSCTPGRGVQIVLVRDATLGCGYRIQTGFPIP